MEPNILSETDILRELKAIEDGEVTVKLVSEEEDIAGGYPVYRTSSGWKLKVFSDAGVWHHIAEVWAPEGTHLNPWDERWMTEYRQLRYYDAPKTIVYPIYRLKPSGSVPQAEVEGDRSAA